jgi:hypothetical protein
MISSVLCNDAVSCEVCTMLVSDYVALLYRTDETPGENRVTLSLCPRHERMIITGLINFFI